MCVCEGLEMEGRGVGDPRKAGMEGRGRQGSRGWVVKGLTVTGRSLDLILTTVGSH